MKKELVKNGLFLDMDATEDKFVVGPKSFARNWESHLDKYEEKANVFLADTLEEARAFAIGYSIGRHKDWKY